jgi:hypothetical protein
LKDYRLDGRDRFKTMTIATCEFIRRFLIHVLPGSFRRIRHYRPFASASRDRRDWAMRQVVGGCPTTSGWIAANIRREGTVFRR